jgi:hypothetical protein
VVGFTAMQDVVACAAVVFVVARSSKHDFFSTPKRTKLELFFRTHRNLKISCKGRTLTTKACPVNMPESLYIHLYPA